MKFFHLVLTGPFLFLFLFCASCDLENEPPPNDATCLISGANDSCECDQGFKLEDEACQQVACPSDATISDDGCVCSTGYEGTISWNESGASYSGECTSLLDLAIDSGDPRGLDAEQVLGSAIEEITTLQDNFNTILREIYSGAAPEYDPAPWSHHIFTASLDNNFALVVGSQSGYPLAAAGATNETRYAAFGSNPIEQFAGGISMNFVTPFNRTIAWLLTGDARSDTAQPYQIALAGLPLTTFQDPILSHFSNYFPETEKTICDEAVALEDCFLESQLVVVGSMGEDSDADAIEQAIQAAISGGVPVLYLHSHYWDTNAYGTAVLRALQMQFGAYGGNYWDEDVASWPSLDSFIDDGGFLGSILRMLNHFQQESFSFDWSGCTEFVGQIFCSQVDGFRSAFLTAAETIQASLRTLDQNNTSIFAAEGNRLLKMLTFLAELYRQEISYPMSKLDDDINPFMKSYFADHAVHYQRAFQSAQPDLGSFSRTLTEDDVTLSTVDVELPVSSRGGYTAIGAYTLPGKSFTIERMDDLERKTWIKINTQRIGSTREFNDGQYDRPKFLQSPEIPLEKGRPLTLSSPYGGALQLVTLEGSGLQSISIRIIDVAQHPVLEDLQNAEAYVEELENSPFDFTEIKTPYIQIHAKTDMMSSAFAAERYAGDVEKFFNYLDVYMIQDMYNLAGFAGEGLALNNSVATYCETLNWDCTSALVHQAPAVQHINIDQYAHCGGGCAGNPYDQSWPLDPLGWGETHETGHNLQRSRLGIYEGRSSEVSNQIYPLHKHYIFNQDSGESLSPDRSAYKTTFDVLQASVGEADPVQYVYEAIWESEGIYDNNNERIAFYMEVVHINEDLLFLDSGWELYTLMYLHERIFTNADENNGDWNAIKEDLGFSEYAALPSDIGGNDFMLISMSFISQKDHRSFFDMWGITYSDEASAQVASYGFPEVPQVFYASEDANADPLPTPVAIDGTSPWPLGD
jgi:immunomodulating metalloprotease